MSIEDRIDDMASAILETLSIILPEVPDSGLLGELVLNKALETYKEVNTYENTKTR